MKRAKCVSLFRGKSPVNGKLAKVRTRTNMAVAFLPLTDPCHSLTHSLCDQILGVRGNQEPCRLKRGLSLPSHHSVVETQASNVTKTSNRRLRNGAPHIRSLNLLAKKLRKQRLAGCDCNMSMESLCKGGDARNQLLKRSPSQNRKGTMKTINLRHC